jgi:predicted nucleotidyltransferase component of viral defense system
MNLSAEFLRRTAAQSGYQAAVLEKVARLGQMAADIARHPLLGKSLALKGGTALNLCYGPPRRLSVDLDYNYVAGADGIERQLLPMLQSSADVRPDRLAREAWDAVKHLTRPTRTESQYLAALAQGELRPELLFPGDAASTRRVKTHPALLWKLENVRAHLGRARPPDRP